MVKLIFLLFLIFINFSNAEVVNGVGKAYIQEGGSYDFCKNESKKNAQRDALEKVIGETIYSNQDLQCRSNEDEALCDLKKRTISNIEGITKPIGKHNFNETSEGDFIVCEWNQQFDVQKIKYYSDFEFKFSMNENKFIAPVAPNEPIELNDKRFSEINFTFEPEQESYLYIFQNTDFLEKPYSFFKIFPNSKDQKNKFNSIVKIPTNDDYKFRISFPKDLAKDTYYVSIVAIASENEIKFFNKYSFEDFQKKLFEIMEQKYRYRTDFYTVLRK